MPTLASIPLTIDRKNLDLAGAALDVSAGSDADVFAAIGSPARDPFPDRDVEIGRLALNATRDLNVPVGDATTVSFALGGEVAASLGVLTSGADVLSRLALTDSDALHLEFAARAGERFLVMRSGYDVHGRASGTHPIGALGTLTFGIEGARKSTFAVVQTFAAADAARDVLQRSIDSWRLPRTVRTADDLAPGTWVIAEADGSIAGRLSTQLGYDFTFVRELKGALTGDIGLKIDLGLRAMVGFNVSGRYIVVLERGSAAAGTELRCRIFKAAKKGWQFGLNLAAGVTGVVDALPQNADDLVAAVFGTHGLQVVKDLRLLDKWTDPATDLSDVVAGLTNDSALALLHRVTGIDPKTEFDRARSTLLAAIGRLDQLPSAVTAALWRLLQDKTGFTSADRAELLAELQLLSDPDATIVHEQLLRLIGKTGLDGTPVGKLLVAAGEKGVLALLDDLPAVSATARRVHDLLDGTVLQNLVDHLTTALQLDTVLKVVDETDFRKLDDLLVARLSAFLDRRLEFEQLDAIKDAIHKVLAARQEIYGKVRQLLARRHEFDLAVSYQRASAGTALIDVTFNTDVPAAAAAMTALLNDANLDPLLVHATAGVELRQAVLTHELTRTSTITVTMPFYQSETASLSSSLASVRPSVDGERILFYELDATSTTTRKNRFRSQLSATAALALPVDRARVHSAPSASVSYRYVHAQADMRRRDVEHLLAPFIGEYFQQQFAAGGESSFDTWLTDLDRRVEDEVSNGSNEFGDVLLALEVLAPAAAMQAWLTPRSDDDTRLAAKRVSVALQAALKRLLAFNYFRRLENLRQNAAAAPLFVYASIPARTNAVLTGDELHFDGGDDVYWNWPDVTLRRAMVRNAQTRHRLQAQLAAARERLIAAGEVREAAFFSAGEAQDFEDLALSGAGDQRLQGLLFTEAMMVTSAAEALHRLAEFRRKSTLTPSAAVEELARFGEAVTTAFQERVTDYGQDTLRPLGTMLFQEAARALDPSVSGRPSALLAMTVLREQRAFDVQTFLAGESPAAADVAVEQRLVTA